MENMERIKKILIEQGAIGRENGKAISEYETLTENHCFLRESVQLFRIFLQCSFPGEFDNY